MMASKIYKRIKSRVVAFLHDPLFLSKWESEHTRDSEDRLTSWVHSGYRTLAGKDGYQGDLHMFVEDLHLRIMPYGSRREQTFEVSLKPHEEVSEEILENSELEKIIAKSISKDDFGFNHLSENITDFIRESVQTIVAHSEAFYEITCKKNDEGELETLKFHYVYPPSMKRFLGWYLQVIPYGVAKRSKIKAGLRFIPKDRMLHITAPKELGGKRELKRIIKRLAYMSSVITPEFYLKSMENNESVGFDVDSYIYGRYIEKAILTRKYGWNQRDYSDKNILEYYSMHRYVVMAKSVALFRQHIIKEFNRSLNNRLVGSGVEVVLEGLATTETVAKDFERLQAGGLKFVDLVKKDQ